MPSYVPICWFLAYLVEIVALQLSSTQNTSSNCLPIHVISIMHFPQEQQLLCFIPPLSISNISPNRSSSTPRSAKTLLPSSWNGFFSSPAYHLPLDYLSVCRWNCGGHPHVLEVAILALPVTIFNHLRRISTISFCWACFPCPPQPLPCPTIIQNMRTLVLIPKLVQRGAKLNHFIAIQQANNRK